MATVAIVVSGNGGITIGGDSRPIATETGAPPELHTNQWGLYQFDAKPRKEERIVVGPPS